MTAPTPEWSAAALAQAAESNCLHDGVRLHRRVCLECLTTLAEQAFSAGQAAERARWEEVVIVVANEPKHTKGERMGARMVGAQARATT